MRESKGIRVAQQGMERLPKGGIGGKTIRALPPKAKGLAKGLGKAPVMRGQGQAKGKQFVGTGELAGEKNSMVQALKDRLSSAPGIGGNKVSGKYSDKERNYLEDQTKAMQPKARKVIANKMGHRGGLHKAITQIVKKKIASMGE